MLAGIVPFAFGAIALVLAGCAGGQVTDVATGQPIAGATVTFRDVAGHSGTVTTDEGGLYSFDNIAGAAPTAGPVTFEVSALDYFPLTVRRTLRYGNGQAVENFLLVFGCG